MWLACAEFQKVIDAAVGRNRALGILISLTYDADPSICWRAIDAIGRCAAHLSTTRPEILRNYLRRLFWMMSDESGAIAWRAPEAIGEIVCADPNAFADFIPMTTSLLDLETEDRHPFLPGILYALGRIGEVASRAVREGLPGIFETLKEPDPQARAMAVWCLARIGEYDGLSQHAELAHDNGKVILYRDGQLEEDTVGGLFAQVLSGFCSKSRNNKQ